jgi:pilus assembly protein Flp/PilA
LDKQLVNYAGYPHETFSYSESLTGEQGKLPKLSMPACRHGMPKRVRGGEQMGKIVKRFTTDEGGSATMEYGLVAAGLSLAIVAVLQGIGMRLTANAAATQVSRH